MDKYSKDLLIDLFTAMLSIRAFEENLVEPILNREIRTPCHLYSGQEAVAVGLCSALAKDDYIFGNHRSHGHYLAKGGSLKAMAAEIYCRENGCSQGRGGSMHLIDPEVGMLGSAPIVSGTISLAVGAALATSIRRDGRIAVSFFGDGATGEGVLYESLNFAALKKLPMIFACENNLYATHMPISECRVDVPISRIAEPFGIESHTVDGNDVLLVHEASQKAVEQCRSGGGPVFLEFLTYRLRGHVGPDDNIQGLHTDIRPKEELEQWLAKDPVKRLEQFLLGERMVDVPEIQSIKNIVAQEVLEAKLYAEGSSSPKPEEMEKHVFA